MISISPVILQAQTRTPAPQAQSQAAQTVPDVPVPPDPAQLRQQIRQSIEAARQAARDAGQAARDGNQPKTVTVGPDGIIVTPSAPGAPGVYVARGGMDNIIPPQVVDMSIAFFIMCAVIIVGWPLSRAFARRVEQRGQLASLDSGTMQQLQRIEQAVDAMAIEVERISESQRFMARLQRDAGAQALPNVESR